METSQTIGKISEALAKAQGQMKPAAFDASNPHFRSRYATLASIMEACRPALSAAGIAVMQGTSIEPESLRVLVTTLLTHSSGEWIKETLSIKPAKDDAQSIGSAVSYARRYCLSALVGIVADDDDDGNAAVGRPSDKQSEKSKVVQIRKESGKVQEASVVNVEQKQPGPNLEKTQAAKLSNGRVAKIRQIFTLSAQLGHSPDQMKLRIGEIVGLDGAIRESSQIPNDQLDRIIEAFQQELDGRLEARKEAA